MSDPQISISGLQAAEWGPVTAATVQDTLRALAEERSGKPHEWVWEINRDAITLLPSEEVRKEAKPVAFARIDFFDGNTRAQYAQGERHRLIRELVLLIDNLSQRGPCPFIEAVEVKAVDE